MTPPTTAELQLMPPASFAAEEGRQVWNSDSRTALGFEKYGTWQKGKRNHVGMKASNDINLWRINLNEGLPRLFT